MCQKVVGEISWQWLVMFSTGLTNAADWRYRVCRQEVRQQQRMYGLDKRHANVCKRWPLWAQTVTDGIAYDLLRRRFHIGNFCFWVPFFKQLLLKNCAVDFVEICNVCTRKVIIKAAKRIFNSYKICRGYCDFYFGVTFLEHTVVAPVLRPVHLSRALFVTKENHLCVACP